MATRIRDSVASRWIAGVLVGVLVVAVGVLAWMAYEHVSPSDATPSPTASSSLGPITPTTTPTPTPTPTPEANPVDLDAQRFLITAGESSVWRAVAGSCTGDAATVVERSTDNGGSFADVTPTYRGVTQVASLDPFDTAQAEMIVGVDAACDPQAMRTFTGGEFWEPYDEVLAASTYVSFEDAGTIATPDGAIDAPCGTAWGLRTSGAAMALICDDTAYRYDGDWNALATDGSPVAVAFDGDTIRVATTGAASCAGILVSTADSDAQQLGCAADAPTSGAVALATRGTQSVLWAGDELFTIG